VQLHTVSHCLFLRCS